MKFQGIKTISLTFIILFHAQFLVAQYYWTEPQSITDSLVDNRNALIMDLPFNGTYDHFLFWEREENSTATAIYYRLLYGADEPVALLADNNVHYRNPQIMLTNSMDDDTLFYFFFESDEGGNYDLYYMVYTPLGFGEPVLLAGSPDEESNFNCSGSGTMVWQEGDRIRYSRLFKWNSPFYFTGPVTIDSNGCSNPVLPPPDTYLYPSYISWLKGDAENQDIYYCYYDWQTSFWSEPVLFYDTGHNTSLKFAMAACYAGESLGSALVWENFTDGAYTMMARDMYEGDFTAGFSQQTPFLPALSLYVMPLDDFYNAGYLSFVNAGEGMGDIYVNEYPNGVYPGIENYLNLSGSPYEETNPEFFNGFCHEYWCHLVLTWESKRNNHWQIFYSYNDLMCSGGTPETGQANDFNMVLSPNPARDACDITYTLREDAPVSLVLCTTDGRQVMIMEQVWMQKGEHNFHLDLDETLSGNNCSGLFLVRMLAGNTYVTIKLIRTD